MRSKLLSLAVALAMQDKSGLTYYQTISKAIDEACVRLEIDKKELLRGIK